MGALRCLRAGSPPAPSTHDIAVARQPLTIKFRNSLPRRNLHRQSGESGLDPLRPFGAQRTLMAYTTRLLLLLCGMLPWCDCAELWRGERVVTCSAFLPGSVRPGAEGAVVRQAGVSSSWELSRLFFGQCRADVDLIQTSAFTHFCLPRALLIGIGYKLD